MITLNVILFSVILLVAGIILRRLIITRNGMLRMVMIKYFASEMWTFFGLLILEAAVGKTMLRETQFTLFILFIPKFFAKIYFYIYLTKQKN